MSLPKFRVWKLKDVDENEIANFSEKLKLDRLISRVLLTRGINSEESYNLFTNAGVSQFHDPFLLKDMDKAVDRILLAVKNKERVLIYGDYDVDGITSSAIMVMFLKELGLDADYHIPDRQEHGYGLSIETFKEYLPKKYNLVITVDCGISAFEEVNFLNEVGIDSIITDHHVCKDKLPHSIAIVATSRSDCNYPFKQLSGVGVALKLIHAISIKLGGNDLHMKYLDLAALGTVADVVSLTGENRAIVDTGLKAIKNSCNTGLKALIDSLDSVDKQSEITAWTFGFVLAPRINAAGRVSDPRKAVEMLITDNYQEAFEIAKQLNDDNILRRETEKDITEGAIAKVLSNPNYRSDKVIVIADSEWHQGVIGIVASRMVDKFYKPVIILSITGEEAKGSARSISGFNIYEALESCKELMERFGGHAPAAGLTIKTDKIDELRLAVNKYAESLEDDLIFQPKLLLDSNLNSNEISFENIEKLSMLEPFGCGNYEPLFWINGAEPTDVKRIGLDSKHLKMTLKINEVYVSAIAFGMGDRYLDLVLSKQIDVACYLQKNVWNGFTKAQLRVVEIRFSPEKILANAFFYSVDEILPFFKIDEPSSNLSGEFFDADYEKIFSSIESIGSTAIMINDISSVNQIVNYVEKNNIDCRVYVGNRMAFCKGEGCSQQDSSSHMILIINPIPGKLPKLKLDKVVIIGTWMNRNYKNEVIDFLNTCNMIIEDFSSDSFCANEIVISVQEIRYIYQHIKMAGSNSNIFTDIFSLSLQIESSYKIKLNSFKVKKALEIFNEIKLISFENKLEDEIEIIINENTSSKSVLLDDSKTFSFIKSLRGSL